MAANRIGARVGDTVRVEQPAAVGLGAAFILFGLPVILALAGLLAARSCSQLVILLAGVSGFSAGLVIAKIINERLARRSDLLPRIVERMEHEGP